MLLQSLVRYYEILSEDEECDIPRQGYGNVKVSFALNLSREGDLLNIITLKTLSGNSKKLIAQSMIVPEQVTRSSGVLPNFLCDNSSYVLGFDNKGKPKRSRECFEAFKKLHIDILESVDNEEAKAVLHFLEKWNVEKAAENKILKDYLDDIYGGANFIFKLDGKNSYVHQDNKIKKAWEFYRANNTKSVIKTCLVTGEKSNISRLHPIIKGIQGGQAMGNSLVSFNARAYESYGNEESQGLNAPVSQYAAFAYGTVLNKLLEDRQHRLTIGDATVVYWAESSEGVYQDVMSLLFDPSDLETVDMEKEKYTRDPIALKEVREILEKIFSGKNINVNDETILDKSTRFFILGLSPNAARISIRFFIQDTFGSLLTNVLRHYQDIHIEKQYENEFDSISIWRLLNETVSPSSKDKSASPLLIGSVMRAILEGISYPTELFNTIMIRIRAEKKIGYYKASIIKGYLMRCKNKNKYKEVLGVSLNVNSNNKPYVLGRLFAILEKAQQDANPLINTTIKDRYFTSACATPANVFPVLLKLSSHHIAKAEYGYISDIRLKEVMDLLNVDDNPFPKQLPLEEQGIFILGYYHQKNAFFKKEEA
ncbi:type I-C CRISPR-associated protein Cas8c/Csd1 [Anaerocolumna aminovalerica]|uniref:type I-C CRISPR-associated protein Cas8c/Csd1 n=1 Tax=Anaerocolumna aminovalerica TaxID=1527 RepID=UPI00248C30AB|nr:type I-C CRISPR-associated protein Cas8c/Csd1 [Anaerocolumna aminovalerica]